MYMRCSPVCWKEHRLSLSKCKWCTKIIRHAAVFNYTLYLVCHGWFQTFKLSSTLYTVTILYKFLSLVSFSASVSAPVGWLDFVTELNSYQLFITYPSVTLFHDLPTIGKSDFSKWKLSPSSNALMLIYCKNRFGEFLLQTDLPSSVYTLW